MSLRYPRSRRLSLMLRSYDFDSEASLSSELMAPWASDTRSPAALMEDSSSRIWASQARSSASPPPLSYLQQPSVSTSTALTSDRERRHAWKFLC